MLQTQALTEPVFTLHSEKPAYNRCEHFTITCLSEGHFSKELRKKADLAGNHHSKPLLSNNVQIIYTAGPGLWGALHSVDNLLFVKEKKKKRKY